MTRLLLALLPLAVLTACPTSGKDTGTPPADTGDTAPVDGDGDGFSADDCDDGDAAIHPGAEETCDGVDQDCDGETDEEATDAATWYADTDQDGYGDAGNALVACERSTGFVADATDCDDTNREVRPSADEVCDDLDNDCDGQVDEDAVDMPSWHPDADGDGWGDRDDSLAVVACDAPEGYLADGTDCWDDNPNVSPGAPETCNGSDDDCDVLSDEDAVDAATWYVDADGDGYGDPATAEASCTEVPGLVADGTDCDDTAAAIHPGADETCDTLDNDCDGAVDDGTATDGATWYADGDGDGWGDPATSTVACTAPSGFLADASDCDDTRFDVNPAATEVCDADARDEDCDGLVNEADPSVDATTASLYHVDTDGDGWGDPAGSGTLLCGPGSGFVADATDCDDTNPDVNPGSMEVCDDADLDEDCDGTADDLDGDGATGTTARYLDEDADGWGTSATSPRDLCDPEGAWTATEGGDCDDTSSSVHPAADEVCNGIDDDCDGSTDVGLTEIWYADLDGDGFGDALSPLDACTAGDGWVRDDTDCDDSDPGVHPGADETCDGVDEDCDGTSDEGVTPSWYADLDGDGFGDAATTTATCTPPPGWVSDATDCDDASPDVHPGAADPCEDWEDQDCDGVIAVCDPVDIGWCAIQYPTSTATDPGVPTEPLYGRVWVDGVTPGAGAGWGLLAEAGWGPQGSDPSAAGWNWVDATFNTDVDGLSSGDLANDEYQATLTVATPGYYAFAFRFSGDGGASWLTCDTDGTTTGGAYDVAREATLRVGDDADNDGHIAAASGGDDCDDTDLSIHPGALEFCDAADLDEDCNGLADDADAGSTGRTRYFPDADGDGWGDAASEGVLLCDPTTTLALTDASDCDDTDSAIHPGASETCDWDDADEDCDGFADDADPEGALETQWIFPDTDEDGYGDATSTGLLLCDPTGAYRSPSNEDCDDTRTSVNPSGREVCDGLDLDEDCDGTADDADTSVDATTKARYYADADADGYGASPSTGSMRCDPDTTWTTTDTSDCDDGRDWVNPGAAEVCDTSGRDEDCDGGANDSDPDGASDATRWYPDADDDGFGDATDAGDLACVAVTPYETADATDCDDTDPNVNPLARERYADGVDQDCDGSDATCPEVTIGWCNVQYPLATDGFAGEPTEDLYGRVWAEGYTVGLGAGICITGEVGYGPRETNPEAGSGWTWSAATYFLDKDGLIGGDLANDEYVATLTPTAGGDYAFAYRFSGDDGATWLYCDTDGTVDGEGYEVSAEATLLVQEDADGDGAWADTWGGDDCDDDDPAIHPGASEVCDAMDADEDCDGGSDDADPEGPTGTTAWYLDADGDGYGDASTTAVLACDATSPWTATEATDCDDGCATCWPGATETDDSADNDCDDIVDEGFRVAGDVLISEVMYNPAGTEPTSEWFEIYNPDPTRDLVLDGLYVYSSTNLGKTFYVGTDALVVPAGGYAVLCHGTSTVGTLCDYVYGSDVNGTSLAGTTWNSDWQMGNSSSVTLQLELDGVLLDKLKYSTSSADGWPAGANGFSIELSKAHLSATDNDTGTWWCKATSLFYAYPSPSTSKDYGTPGVENSCSTP